MINLNRLFSKKTNENKIQEPNLELKSCPNQTNLVHVNHKLRRGLGPTPTAKDDAMRCKPRSVGPQCCGLE